MDKVLVISLVFTIGACTSAVEFSADELDQIRALSPVPDAPVDPTNAVESDPDAAWLGQRLFFDTRLSRGGDVACATCHDPALGFSDGLVLSEGIHTTRRHAPTLYNVSSHRWFYWDGRKDSAWAQALGPIEDPGEHGSSRLAVAHIISDDTEYKQTYEGLFGPLPNLEGLPAEGRPAPEDPTSAEALAWEGLAPETQHEINVLFTNIGKSIAAYERTLVSRDAPFDDFVSALTQGQPMGEEHISASAQRGLRLFIGEAGCTQCHSGPLFSDLAFHNVGLGPREHLDSEDQGRWDAVPMLPEDPFNGAGLYSDDPAGVAELKLETLSRDGDSLGAFKTPGLRSVALSAPYMHGGHFGSLEEVVQHYNDIQELPLHGHREEVLVPLDLSKRDIQDLVAFLESLTGAPLPDELMSPL